MSASADRVRNYLEAIACSRLGAFVHVDGAGALRAAQRADVRFALAVKDNIDVAGMPTAAGIGAWRHRVASQDAECIARLRRAGDVFLGKTLMDEAAFGALGDNPWFGRCHNPRRRGYTPGGSSAGSAAAVAAGLCDAALGTDTLGSVRIPAAYCGVVGYVPSPGRLPMSGVVPLAPSFDRLGVLARSVERAAAVAEAPMQRDLREVPIGILAPRIGDKVARLHGGPLVGLDAEGFDWGALRRAVLLLLEREAAQSFRELLAERPEALSPGVRAALRFGAEASAERVERAKALIGAARSRFAAWLARCPLLLLPTVPHAPFAFEAPVPADQADFCAPASALSLPAISVPLEVPGETWPLAVQLVAACGDDARLLGVARLLS